MAQYSKFWKKTFLHSFSGIFGEKSSFFGKKGLKHDLNGLWNIAQMCSKVCLLVESLCYNAKKIKTSLKTLKKTNLHSSFDGFYEKSNF